MPSTQTVVYVGYIGAAANWLIPIATINNIFKQPKSQIDPVMTGVLALYSCVFFRWALAVGPVCNVPLSWCHMTNATAQLTLLGKKYFGPDEVKAVTAAAEGKK